MGSLESIGRVLLSLVLVLGLMWLLGRWARPRMNGKGQPRDTMTVLARQRLSRNASVAVVRIADRALVLGITDGQINLLSETELASFDAQPAGLRTQPRAEFAVTDVEPDPADAVTVRRTRGPARGLEGSALSAATWIQVVDALRNRTVRR